ncbi:sporulation integral membrane protein YtvI [Paenibacillus naphthalenovorans]|uniref:sporulation integral membrane protein YtvI n=1 Tax=Paenibacillus naphthalenovorans TaxID=162209 RepID=UPI003D2CB679
MSLRTAVFCALGAILLYGLFTTGFPFLLAILIAIFLERPVQMMMKYFRIGRMTASAAACTLFTAVILGFFYMVGFKIISELIQLLKRAPGYLNDAILFFENTTSSSGLLYQTLPSGVAEQVVKWMESNVGSIAENLNGILLAIYGYSLGVAKVIPSLFIFFVVFIIGLYLISFHLPKLYESFLNLFDTTSRSKVSSVLNDLRRAILGFLFAQLLISLLTYILTLAGLLMLRVDYPLAIALLIILVDILPVLGVSAVFVPWLVYCFLVGNTQLGIGLLILLIVIVIFRRMIEPKIIGDAIGINALAALVSMYAGFQLIGVVGLVLGPVMVIVYQAMRRVGLLKINIKLEG